MFFFYLRVTRNRNVMLLVKLKDVPGVLDGDQLLSEVDSSAELCDAIRKLCAGQATKTMLVSCSAEPCGGTLGPKDSKLVKT